MRRLTSTSALAVIVAAAAASPALASPPPIDPPSKPSVNMEKVLLAAQWDPRKPGEGITPGAKASVKAVERRLARKGYLAKSLVDGHFGSSTISAYAAWQRHLHYSGLAATGLPGPTSLKKLLGKKYFLYNIVRPGKHVSWSGVTINLRTKRMLKAAGRLVAKGCVLDLTQGSYNPGGVGASAGTHDGGGAADLNIGHLCGKHRPKVVASLRRVGFAAWYRPTIPGLWNAHIHAIAINDPDLSTGAQHQVGDYYQGKDGLAGGAPDTGPKVKKRTWEDWKRAHI
jgi:peptidoglycan hydrolase-like protein with peptidoglycan-binding domain